MSIFDPSVSVLSFLYQEFDFTLKPQNLILNCLKTFQIHLCFGFIPFKYCMFQILQSEMKKNDPSLLEEKHGKKDFF